jgi:molecular chaperone HtpG
MTVEAHKETLGFQAEVVQLLDLMIHSLYSNKEIFLRELISNASDAADKLRFEAIATEALFEEDTDLRIAASYDKEARTISVSDNGIGMSRQEVIDNIGTIAKSGTRDFFKALSGDQQKDAHLIGQFGVGFYSSFIVADKVTLATRRAGLPSDAGVQWESDGQGAYSLETIEKPDRGTTVTLHLREGEDELLSGYRLRTIIRKYSDHISLPILMAPEAPPAEGEESKPDLETVNRASALWTRGKSEITEEEYTEFYKHVAHEFTEPLAFVHSKMEGKYEYTILLYVPAHAPFDLWNRDSRHGVKLYVRRVFIMDDAEQLLPNYLRFVRGIVDSSDLPLNVSREILQHSRIIDTIKTGSVKKILGLLKELATDQPEKYATFWKEFGTALKEGIAEDSANRDELARLVRFSTTVASSETQDVSLETYVGRMKDGQDKIYYLVADSFAAAKSSPLLEIFKKKGVEVMLLGDPIDNWVVAHLTEFDGKQLQSVARGEVDLGKVGDTEEASEGEKPVEDSKELLERMKSALGDRVKDVRVTSRLTTSPACLVVDERGIDPTFVRLMKAAGQPVPSNQPIFEVNLRHPIVTRLAGESDGARFGDWAQLLFDQAVLSEGGQLEDPAAFVTRLNDLLVTLGKS